MLIFKYHKLNVINNVKATNPEMSDINKKFLENYNIYANFFHKNIKLICQNL